LLAADVLSSKEPKLLGELKKDKVVLLVKAKGQLKIIEIQVQRKSDKSGNS